LKLNTERETQVHAGYGFNFFEPPKPKPETHEEPKESIYTMVPTPQVIKPEQSTVPSFTSQPQQEVYEIPNFGTFRNFILDSKSFCDIDIPGKQIYLNPVIAEQQIILIPGWRGSGKTWFALSLADAITRRLNFGPWEADEAVPVMYVDGELPPGDLQERIFLLNPTQEMKQPLYIYNDCFMSSKGVKRASLLDVIWQNDLKDTLLDLGVKVVFFDNISSLSPEIDENKKSDWDPINQWLLELRFAGITSVLLHHTGKEGKQRGTSGREDNLDMVIMLKQPPDYTPEKGCDFTVSFSKARVSHKYLPLLVDIRFTMGTTPEGFVKWGWSNAKTAIRETVISMLKEGCNYNDIIAATGITKGRISQIKKEMAKQ